jgi:Fic family protein
MQTERVHERLDARLRTIPAGEVNALITRVAAIDEFKGWWTGRSLPTSSMRKHLKTMLAVSALASTRINGRSTAAVDVHRRFLRGRPLRDQRISAQVAAYSELLGAVFDEHAGMRFGQDLILQFHDRLLKYSHRDPSLRGRYKTVADAPADYLRKKMESPALRSADPYLTPRLMAAATEWTASRLAGPEFHPLLVIAGFVLEFLAIRPFADGNGRLSRILTNLLLLQCGYVYVPYVSLERVIADHWTEYYLGLRRSQAHATLPRPDIAPWLHAFLEVLQLQAGQLRLLLDSHTDDSQLSQNQQAVLRLLERHEEVTNRLVCHALGMPKDTAKQVLGRLAALKLLRRVGAGRAVRYRRVPPQDGDGKAR